ncbi:MAG: hypothetical protein ACXU82_03610 [Caulobacteraceae bacterium]
MDAMRHAYLARQLVIACGGLDKSAQACRLSRSRLSEIGDPKTLAFMPADVIADLEGYCGEPHYSRALAEERPYAVEAGDLVAEACETTEVASQLQALARLASHHPHFSALERAQILSMIERLDGKVRELRVASGGGAQ